MRAVNLVFRIFLAALAAFLAWAGTGWNRQADRLASAFEAAREARLVDLEVDLGKPGLHEGILRRGGYEQGHGHDLKLLFASPFPTEEAARRALAGLSMTLAVREDREGAEPVLERTIAAADLAPPAPDGIRSLGIVPEGTYQVTLAVVSPAADPGPPVRLVGTYDLCGCEVMAASYLSWIAIACFGGSALLVLLLIADLLRQRRASRHFRDA